MKNRRTIIPYKSYLNKVARKLRNNSTLSEVLLWEYLSRKQMMGYSFYRQKPIDNYIVDFYAPELMLVIEIDGSSHDFEEVQISDPIRQARLESFGLSFLRFTDRQVKTDMLNVLRVIEVWIEDFQDNEGGDVEGIFDTTSP